MASSVGVGVGTAAGVVGFLVLAWHGLTWSVFEVDEPHSSVPTALHLT